MKLRNIICGCVLIVSSAMAQSNNKPISLRTMGSLMYGGTVTEMPDGSTFHGDHGYAQYYIPTQAHTYPIILWYGIGQSGKCLCLPYQRCPD